MIEIHENLFVGGELDERQVRGQSGWFFVHACKEPYHRQALGYTGRAASKDHPEYLIARRDGRLILNLVDAADVNYVPADIVDAALAAIDESIRGNRVLLHCNQGQSRSPTIGLLYMLRFTDRLAGLDMDAAIDTFRAIYPPYNPARGMADYARINWHRYRPAD